jgi:pimeloyl-ACP methyl ester carboxylesterase
MSRDRGSPSQAPSGPAVDVAVRSFASSAGQLAYLDQGDPSAPLVVLQHGFPDYPKTFLPLAERLCNAGYRAVSPFLRGYVPSTTSGPFDDARMGSDLVELTVALSPGRPAVLVGHDWGAVATYAAVRLRPDAFRKAITIAVPHVSALMRNMWSDPAQQRKSAYMAFFMLPLLPERIVPRHDFAFIDALWRRWSPGYVPPAHYMRELKSCLRASMPAPLGHYRALPSSLRQKQSSPLRSAGIGVPLLHLHGENDGCIALASSRGEERYFNAGFRREVLSGGHFLHLEAPDRVASSILDFIGPAGA